MTATTIYKTTATTKLQINYKKLKISYFMSRICHYLHNTYQSTPWGAENNYSKVSNIEGCSLPACMETEILYSVQWVFQTEENRACLEEQHMKSNDKVISIDSLLKIWSNYFDLTVHHLPYIHCAQTAETFTFTLHTTLLIVTFSASYT